MNLKLQSILINFNNRILLYSPFFKDLSSEDAIRLLKGSLAKPPKEEGSVRYTQSDINPSLPPLSRTSKRSYHSDIRNTTTNTKPTTQQFSMKNKRLNALRKKKPAYCQPSTAFQSTSSPPPSSSSSNRKSKPNTPIYSKPNTPKYQQPTTYRRTNINPQPPSPTTQYWSSSSYNNNNNTSSSQSPLKAIERIIILIYYIFYIAIYTNISSYKPSSSSQQQQLPPPEYYYYIILYLVHLQILKISIPLEFVQLKIYYNGSMEMKDLIHLIHFSKQ